MRGVDAPSYRSTVSLTRERTNVNRQNLKRVVYTVGSSGFHVVLLTLVLVPGVGNVFFQLLIHVLAVRSDRSPPKVLIPRVEEGT